MDEKAQFVVYYSGLVAMQFHPRNEGNWPDVEALELLAQVADKMVELTKERYE